MKDLTSSKEFIGRHIGPSDEHIKTMLTYLNIKSLDELIQKIVPDKILEKDELKLDDAISEDKALKLLKQISQKNKIYKNYLGAGYYGTITPNVILRNILENPGWYTAYTPYQPEVAQGRLEMLLNFQQMIIDLTKMDIANASLLDEGTAAAEAVGLCQRINPDNLNRNQPRKCWDHTIIAWVEFVEMHYNVNVKNTIKKNTNNTRPIKLIIGTQINAYWNLWDVLENEVKFRDVPLNYIKDTIIEVPMPQQLSDKEINILYNSCDVGCNNCNGGGYELTVFECLGLGIPQVASYVGGIREYLNENNSIPIKSTIYQYLDNKSNGIGGKSELTDPHEFALAFWKYFNNPELAKKHGKNGRENILKNYRWETLVDYFYSKILSNI